MRGKLIRNSLLTLGASLGIAGIGFVMVPFFIGRLGSEQFGLIGIALMFLAGSIGFMELGLQTSITKYTAEYHERGEPHLIAETVGTACVIFLGMGVLSAIGGWFGADALSSRVLDIPEQHQPVFRWLLRLIFLSYLFQLPSLVFVGMIEGMQRFGIARGIHVAASFGTAVASVIAISNGHTFSSVIVITVAFNFLQFMAYAVAAHRLIPGGGLRRMRFSIVRLREIWRMSRYVFMGKISGLVFNESDRFLIGIFLGPIAFAAYEVLFRLPRFLKTLVGFTSGALLPAASQLHTANSLERLQRLYMLGIRLNLLFFLPVISISALLAEPFLRAWVGPEYTQYALLLQLLFLWNISGMLTGFGGLFLVGTNTSLREATYYSYAITALKIGILIVLLRPLGLVAVVLGTVVSTTLALPGLLRLYHRALMLPPAAIVTPVLSLLWPLTLPIAVHFLTRSSGIASFPGLFLHAVVFCSLYWALAYTVSLSRSERDTLIEIIRTAGRPFRAA